MQAIWDEAVAATLVGTRVHLEHEYAGPGGRVIRRARFCGRVVAADRLGGIDLRLDDRANAFRLPPDLSTFQWAYPGEYPDDATGELVENPDVRATWHIMAPERPPEAFWRMFGRREGEGHAA